MLDPMASLTYSHLYSIRRYLGRVSPIAWTEQEELARLIDTIDSVIHKQNHATSASTERKQGNVIKGSVKRRSDAA